MSAKIDLEADNVFVASMTLEEARNIDTLEDMDEVLDKIDEAQGHVHMGKGTVSFVIIQIQE